MHSGIVLTSLLESNDTRALGQMLHNRHFPLHVLDIHGGPELPLRDRLTREEVPRGSLDAEVGDTELAASELSVEQVPVLDVLLGDVREDSNRS